ncbi:MAG: hypothetical protein BJ554DRAFT_3099 [Olpidium bornovanus]|uniref:Uncharacterized protein n=1 Tax=Olpidium bornovanus TaxID=278681 RepID=A0A8H7ZPV4_9FUNG|nr:MAG: hypothetical protein BJ554DRAFT_3099 [Olpidium bornovanus]
MLAAGFPSTASKRPPRRRLEAALHSGTAFASRAGSARVPAKEVNAVRFGPLSVKTQSKHRRQLAGGDSPQRRSSGLRNPRTLSTVAATVSVLAVTVSTAVVVIANVVMSGRIFVMVVSAKDERLPLRLLDGVRHPIGGGPVLNDDDWMQVRAGRKCGRRGDGPLRRWRPWGRELLAGLRSKPARRRLSVRLVSSAFVQTEFRHPLQLSKRLIQIVRERARVRRVLPRRSPADRRRTRRRHEPQCSVLRDAEVHAVLVGARVGVRRAVRRPLGPGKRTGGHPGRAARGGGMSVVAGRADLLARALHASRRRLMS